MSLRTLPSDIILEICCHLPIPSLLCLLRTCKKLWKLSYRENGIFEKRRVGDYHFYGSSKFWNEGISLSIEDQELEVLKLFIKKYAVTPCGNGDSKERINESWGENLRKAGQSGRRDIVDILIHSGYCKDMSYGMYGAARGGHKHLVDYFIENDPSLNNLSQWNEALHEAASGGHIPMVKYCLAKGATNIGGARNGAAREGQLKVLQFLYPMEADPYLGMALWCAVNGEHFGCVQFLMPLSSGISTKRLNECLETAAGRLHKGMVEYLVQFGANDWNAGLSSCVGMNHILRKEKEHTTRCLELIEYFISKGANDWNGALKAAVDSRNAELMEMFIKKGADLDKCIEAYKLKWNPSQHKGACYFFDYLELLDFKEKYDKKYSQSKLTHET